MIEVYELLRAKENELARVRSEVEALRTATALLSEPDDVPDLQPGSDSYASAIALDASADEENSLKDSSSTDSDAVLFASKPPKRSRLRDWIGRAVGE